MAALFSIGISTAIARNPDDVYDVSVIEFANGKSEYLFGPMISDPLPVNQAGRKGTLAEVAAWFVTLDPPPEALLTTGDISYSRIPKGSKIRPLNKMEVQILAQNLPERLRGRLGLPKK